MECKVKSSIKVDAQRSIPGYDLSSIRKNSLTAMDVIKRVEDTTDDIYADNYQERAKDRKLLGKALRRIRGFIEHGLVVSDKSDYISGAASGFINNVVRNTRHAIDTVNKLTFNGLYSGRAVSHIYVDDKGNYQSKHSPEELNNMIKNFLGKRLVTKDSYVSQGKNGLLVSEALMLDINEYYYNTYLQKMGLIVEGAFTWDQNTPQKYKEEVSELKTVPIIAQINSKITALRTAAKRMKSDDSIAYSPQAIADINNEIAKLKRDKIIVKDNLSIEFIQSHYENVLNEIEYAIRPESDTYFSEDTLMSYIKALKLIKRTTNRDYKDNPVLEFSETKDRELIQSMDAYSNRAKDLEVRLNEIVAVKVKEIANSSLPGEFTDEQFSNVKEFKGGIRRAFQGILGLHHLENTYVHFIYKRVNKALSSAFYKARNENDILEKLYKALKATGFYMKNFYQENEDGHSNGRVVDVFSSKWFKEESKLYGTRGQGKISSNAAFTRMNHVITLNPNLLFEKSDSEIHRKAKRDLYDSIYESMGRELGDERIAEAKRLWDLYKESEKAMKESKSTEEFQEWELRNSPMKRIQNWNKTDIDHGTDNFLLLIPKRYDVDGEFLGYHDPKYDKIKANDKAMKFYKYMRYVFTKNQEAMYNFEEKFHPPTLAYIGKSVSEHISNGDWKSATRLFLQDEKKHYSIKEKKRKRKFPVDPITGEKQPHLKMEIHSIPAEVNRRVSTILANDAAYQAVAKGEGKNIVEEMRIKDKVYKEVYKEVEEERSEDLLQSVVMSNYAVHTFIQKNIVETSVNLAKHVLNSNLVTVEGEKEEDIEKARRALDDHLTHFINHSLYDARNLDASTVIGEDEDTENQDKEGSVVTSRSFTQGLMSYARVTVLGFSAMHAVLNMGQHFFSNLSKAAEQNHFNFGDLFKAYRDILVNKKDRALIDKLFIVGDVAYSYSKRSIHEQNKLWAKTHPMYLQTSAEKLNQGSTSLAIMRTIKLTDSNTGKELSLYEALSDDGKLADNYIHADYNTTSDELLIDLTVDKIRPVVMQTAGDYLSPLYLERSEIGKLGMMFKKWLPEMLMDRLHAKKYDYTLKKETEGRLRALFMATKQLLTGDLATLKEDRARVEAARAGLFEIGMAVLMRALFMSLGTLACDSPECKNKKGVALFSLNMIGRLADDVGQLALPFTMYKQVMNPFAIEGTITDVYNFTDELTSYLVPGGDSGKYKTRTQFHDKGDLKFMTKLEKLIPLYRTEWYNYKKLSRRLMYENNFIERKSED